VVTVPQTAAAHYKHVARGVFGGGFWWIVLAAFLRLVIFLSDYFRRSRDELRTDNMS